MGDLIDRTRMAAKILRDIGGQSAMAATVDESADALAAARAYTEGNPLGGPAKRFEVMASRIRAGEPEDSVLADYGLCRSAAALHAIQKREQAEARAERLAEALREVAELAEAEGDALSNARSVARNALRAHDQEVGNE